ncbi:MAG TPA: group III truncated hemoglobin [Bosea sp. (in: a-proteobacteria)]|jgi:hemoglobin|uniref:group III truncated hemoglobin n=1 Tax=Bosea sp. (in: a-proteobacteria) TaxID=1871050 RepID=UPI002E11878D|nr:group III truncated hemoglobin [Bosea sp. (in: a-proteobacteria)]
MTDDPLTKPGAAHPAITDAMIATLVQRFYERAREDALIGPIFMGAVHDWDEHIANITDFWSSVMLRTGRYQGRPMRPHLILPLEPWHFDRWLVLFEATARSVCADDDIADAFIIRARRIADSFEMARASHRGEIARPRHSLG